MKSVRRSDFDVTNTVQVSVPAAVLEAVEALYRPVWPELEFAPLEQAFEHFERLFAGRCRVTSASTPSITIANTR
jgi:hypothetical protein